MSEDSKREFLSLIDGAIEQIVSAKDDPAKIHEGLEQMKSHISRFRSLKIYRQIPDTLFAEVALKLPKLDDAAKRRLVREMLETLRIDKPS